MEEETNAYQKELIKFKEQNIERSYSVNEFFYDTSFDDYKKIYRFIAQKPLNFDFASLYQYSYQSAQGVEPIYTIDHVSRISDDIQSIGRHMRYSEEKNLEIRYDADLLLKQMTDLMKEYNLSHIITAVQEHDHLESGFSYRDIKL